MRGYDGVELPSVANNVSCSLLSKTPGTPPKKIRYRKWEGGAGASGGFTIQWIHQ